MKPKVSAPIASLLAILLATTTVAHAQPASEGTRYRVIDLGTLGGDYTEPGGINDRGEIEGWGNLAGDSQIQAFFWKNGVLTAIPGLAATNSTAGWAISNSGQVGVAGETPDPDPLGEDFCRFGNFTICRPFVWQEGTVTLLPLPAGNNAAPTGFNNINEVTGKAERAELDPTCGSSPQKLQTHGIVWRNGKIRRLLPNFPGDTQGAGHSINDLGQVVGWSGNCIGPPFLSHALLWDKGKRIDLGTLGGPNNQAYNINNKGDVVGFSGNADGSVVHGFLWHRGHMRDLGVLPGNVFSFGAASNDAGDIVGASGDANGERTVIWQRGTMIDLNTLVTNYTYLFLLEGDYINSRGQIVGTAFDTGSGQIHGYLATPGSERDDSGISIPQKPTLSNNLNGLLPESVRRNLRSRLRGRRIALPGEQ